MNENFYHRLKYSKLRWEGYSGGNIFYAMHISSTLYNSSLEILKFYRKSKLKQRFFTTLK